MRGGTRWGVSASCGPQTPLESPLESLTELLRLVQVGPDPANDLPTQVAQRILAPFLCKDGVCRRLPGLEQLAVLLFAVELTERPKLLPTKVGTTYEYAAMPDLVLRDRSGNAESVKENRL